MTAQALHPRLEPNASARRRYHFHIPGLLYVLVTFFIAVGAINSQNNLLFASLGLAIGGLLMSGILSGGCLIGIRCQRDPIGNAAVGRPLVLKYRIFNENRWVPSFGLSLAEHSAGTANWSRFIQTPRAFTAHVGGRQLVQVVSEVVPRKRGRMMLGVVRISTTFPFGLARKSVNFEIPAMAVVYPVELPVCQGVLRKLSVRADSGVGGAVSPGLGDEFYGLREYSDGDSPRWIAWRRSARTGQMVVRQNTTPTPRQLWVVLDIRDGAESRLVERAIAIAAALIRAASREGAAVGLSIPRTGLAVHPQVSGRSLRNMLDHLAEFDIDAVSQGSAIPDAALRSVASAVVHAGPVDRSFGGNRSFHIDAADPGDILVQGNALTRALAILDGADPSRTVAQTVPESEGQA